MSTYDKSIEISREEEGSYQRREVDFRPRSPVTTHYVERYHPDSKPSSRALKQQQQHQQRQRAQSSDDSDDDSDNFEEWTTSKRKVNHKTRQVETRVSRQLLVRGGEVIADSGPQVTTRIKEDNKVEECEKEKAPKHKGRFEALKNAPEAAEASGLVLGEKKEIQRKSREVREENMQYHDERFKELTGKDVHRRAIQAPHELITINDKTSSSGHSRPRGKMVHYSNKGKKYQDTDEILEVAKLAIDGSITKEVKRTKHHEEFSEDELPDEKGEAEQLRRKPVVERSSRRHADYVNDFDQVDAEPTGEHAVAVHYGGSERGHSPIGASRTTSSRVHGGQRTSRKPPHTREEEEAFPRYQIDPLLNSLRDEDFKPLTPTAPANTMPIYSSSSKAARRRGQSASSASSASEPDPYNRSGGGGGAGSRLSRARSPGAVEVPEEYRANRQKLMAGRSGGGGGGSTLSHKSNRSQQAAAARRREDAATQARLTDEEVERRSLDSQAASLNSHEKTAKYLQRQSTPNSSRHYYYGDAPARGRHAKGARGKQQQQQQQQQQQLAAGTKRPTSLSSSSSSSSASSTELEAAARRKQGAQSRDSGFKSPHSQRAETPASAKWRSRPGAASPAESAGQRSVKTTTTTLSAGLADRPLSRQAEHQKQRKSAGGGQRGRDIGEQKLHDDGDGDGDDQRRRIKRRQRQATSEDEDEADEDDGRQSVITITNSTEKQRQQKQAFDTVSLASLQGPNATKIKVPYQRVIEIEREQAAGARKSPGSGARDEARASKQTSGSSEMGLQEDIASLSKRLASISQAAAAAAAPLQHFDYKPIVASVHGPSPTGARHHVIDRSYNVIIQQQNSPFHGEQPRLGEGCSSSAPPVGASANNEPQPRQQADNNNEANFSLEQYVKYRATPALVVDRSLLSSSGSSQQERMALGGGGADDDDEDERMSQNSSACSLQSARTYNIRKLDASQKQQQLASCRQADSAALTEPAPAPPATEQLNEPEFDENGNGKPAAWIFDPRDNSSTAIVPPARPKQPEAPKVDAKTEELSQARGGRSYYLELVDPSDKLAPHSAAAAAVKRSRLNGGSMDSLYSRWNSQGALHQPGRGAASQACRPLSSTRQNLPRQVGPVGSNTRLHNGPHQTQAANTAGDKAQRRQLPFGGPPALLGDRSKSSSCLLSVTKPSKYSIYGGFRKPGESNKPVPRLSYSRAIGPRSARVDTTPAAPSRYLKMR